MKVVAGTGNIPFVFSVHHASDNFAEFSERSALNDFERKAYSDYGTSDTVPTIGICSVIAETSRGIVDLNRSPEDTARFAEVDFANPPNRVWLENSAPNAQEQALIHERYFVPYHKALDTAFESGDGLSIVVAWDNTADKIIGKNEQGADVQMPAIILSNNGDEESAERKDSLPTTCDPRLLVLVGSQLADGLQKAGLAHDIHYNLVFKGKHVVQAHTDWPKNHYRQSFQVEYSTALTHDQQTLEAIPGRLALFRSIAEQALLQAYNQYKLLQ